jgi:hypothetical protein
MDYPERDFYNGMPGWNEILNDEECGISLIICGTCRRKGASECQVLKESEMEHQGQAENASKRSLHHLNTTAALDGSRR